MGGLSKPVFPGSDQKEEKLIVFGEKIPLLVQVLHALEEEPGQRGGVRLIALKAALKLPEGGSEQGDIGDFLLFLVFLQKADKELPKQSSGEFLVYRLKEPGQAWVSGQLGKKALVLLELSPQFLNLLGLEV